MTNPTCLLCGGILEPVTITNSPPWICKKCSITFYNAELTSEAQKHWRPHQQDFGNYSKALSVIATAEQAGRKRL